MHMVLLQLLWYAPKGQSYSLGDNHFNFFINSNLLLPISTFLVLVQSIVLHDIHVGGFHANVQRNFQMIFIGKFQPNSCHAHCWESNGMSTFCENSVHFGGCKELLGRYRKIWLQHSRRTQKHAVQCSNALHSKLKCEHSYMARISDNVSNFGQFNIKFLQYKLY